MDVQALDFASDGDLDLMLAIEFLRNDVLLNSAGGLFVLSSTVLVALQRQK